MLLKELVLLVLLLAHSCHSSETLPVCGDCGLRLRQLHQDETQQEEYTGEYKPDAADGGPPVAASAAAAASDSNVATLAGTAAAEAAVPLITLNPSAALQSLLQAQMSLPEDILAVGYKPLASPALRNWRRLARRLTTRGTTISIAAFGSQITMGHQTDSPSGSWVEELQFWLERAFPQVAFSVLNLARGGTDIVPAATCWYQYVPSTVDLVMIEGSTVGCVGNLQCHSFAAPRVAAYELLLRRLIRRAPGAALLSVGTFDFQRFRVSRTMELPNPLYGSGEDHHEVLARRYGIPTASTRDALYDLVLGGSTVMLQGVGLTAAQLLVNSVTPTSAGHKAYAEIVAYTMQQALAKELRALADDGGTSEPAAIAEDWAVQAQQLPPPVSPLAAAEVDGEPLCAMDQALQRFVSVNSSSDWKWGARSLAGCPHSHCRVWGYRAKGHGTVLNMTINTADVTAADSSLGWRWLVAFFTQTSPTARQSRIGRAQLDCLSGCECKSTMLGKPATQDAQLGITLGYAQTNVTAHPNCSISLRIHVPEGSDKDEFILNGLAVAPFGHQTRAHIDRLAFQYQSRME
ncbi:hypothetical protein COO60DRAFT_929522 [Scenedesmus sp. NREL 46B-D3]|nr:hypothetical protein COO60DRAFT_929522 [Scenedesmus sp. NREL 46B-D3]